MEKKTINWLIASAIVLIIGLIAFITMLHVNDVQNIQVVQSMDGEVTVRREGGWYLMVGPRIWTYPKASVEICNEVDKDAIVMQFSNKSTASLNCQIGYRIDGTNDEQVIKLHQLVEGSDEKIWKIVQTSLQTAVQRVASQYTPSESVERFEEFQVKIAKAIIHDPELLEKGIDVVSFTCAGLPKYDNETVAQFNKQKEADLAKRLAAAEKEKLEAETIKTQANYEKEIAEFKGKADAETAKLKTEAEREKELATIAAQKQVEVARLEKEKAVIEVERQKEVAKVEAEKQREVAEVEKQTEAAKLETVKLKAEQLKAEADAKQIAIEKSGAITELQQAELELQKAIAQFKWDAIGKAIAGVKLPAMMNINGGGSSTNGVGVTAMDQFIQLLTVEKLGALTPHKAPATK
jgi:hypothetical protein